MTTYQGHRSFNAYQVHLWINNDESLYNHALTLLRKHGRKGAARRLATGERYPDGATFNYTCCYEALEGMEN